MAEVAWAIVIGGGLLFWVYWVGSQSLAQSEQVKYTGRHAGLYGAACLNVVFACFLFAMGCVLIVVLVPVGYFGWAVLINAWWGERSERRAFWKAHPIPRLQFRFTDLYTVVAFYAIIMAGYALLTTGDGQTERNVALLTAVLLPICILGLLASADLHRRMPSKAADSYRSWRIVFMLVWFSATAGIGGAMAWMMWRRALFLFDFEDWRKEQQAAQLQEAIRAYATAAAAEAPASPQSTP